MIKIKYLIHPTVNVICDVNYRRIKMIYVEGNWENADSLQDVARIIKEYYNTELADKLYEIIDEIDCQGNYKEQVDRLENVIDEIRDLVMLL